MASAKTNRNEDHFPVAWLDLENECFWCWGLKSLKRMRELVEECIKTGYARSPWEEWEATINDCQVEHCLAYTADCSDPRAWNCEHFYLEPYQKGWPRHYKSITRLAVEPQFAFSS